MTRSFFTMILLALAGFLFQSCASAECCEGCEGEDEIVALASLPAAVQATILEHANGRPIDEIEHEFEDGEELYCVELDSEDDVEFHVAPDGRFLGYDDDGDDDKDDDDDDDRADD